MPWIQLKINANEENAEQIGDMLSGNGAQAVTFLDAKDNPLYEPKLGETTLWPDTTVVGLFDAETNMQQIITRLSQANVLANDFVYKLDQLEDKDWEREWMDNFKPMQFGDRLWICPSWCDIPNPDAVNIMLDPGLAFGTGTHPTTSLCLQWLDKQDVSAKTVVDFGCGSGILGIAALLLGAEKVIAIDIDPQALIATKENAKRNGVEERVEVFLPADQPHLEADLVIANILAAPLRELQNIICSFAKPGGQLILSGILDTQADELNGLYSKDFTMSTPTISEQWSRLEGIKHAS